ncbi:zinc-dependent alcohol dehydrogenase family protein [Chitinophaga arvensicola]|uniref:NADPH:quinone reductase n=1 Tax=Chitinophaga arvensicola TaxID=29529 RepID=A0A1I0RBA5_9BACT|nr:NAD(P)-dependent alcohol dehydrogenase [Chitinophaga arvensicola]SEW37910.1 NADPH:quinone reductase [Chitinophaga arvensicola]
MKSYQITADYSIPSLALKEQSIRELLPNEVLVKISAVSLNYRDLLVVTGFGRWKPPVGRVPVSDGVGYIVDKGSAVTTLSLNDRVAGLFLPNWIDGKLSAEKLLNPLGGGSRDGLLQEYAIFDQHELIQIPAFLSDEEGATLPCAGLTAWNGIIERGNITPDSTVLIQGTGGVSLFSLQFALMAGAKVILLSGSNEKLQLAGKLGAHHLINYNEHPDWEKQVKDITNGHGVNHVVEVVGGNNINRSVDVATYDATISIIGLIGGLSGEISTSPIMSKQIKLQGIEVGSKAMFERMNNALVGNNIHPVIHKIYDFKEAKDAFTYLKDGKHFGKIIIKL